MFFQTVFSSLLLIFLGLALALRATASSRFSVSIWGFFAGFQFGATIFTNIFGQGFLSTVISWVVGLLVAHLRRRARLPVLCRRRRAAGRLCRLPTGHWDHDGDRLPRRIADLPGGAARSRWRMVAARDLSAFPESARPHPHRARWRGTLAGRRLPGAGTHLARLVCALARWGRSCATTGSGDCCIWPSRRSASTSSGAPPRPSSSRSTRQRMSSQARHWRKRRRPGSNSARSDSALECHACR